MERYFFLTGPFNGWPSYILGHDGPEDIDTIQLEAMREGIDDGKYIYTLQSLIEKLKSNPDLKANSQK